MTATSSHTSLREATAVWWKIGWLSFGGPAAQIALMHRMTVEEKKWLDEQRFLNALNFCMLLPGPEAMQLATYCGWRLHGTIGGLIAGLCFVLPGAALIMALATIYSLYGSTPLVTAAFYGIKAAVLAIVLEALLRISKKALSNKSHWVIGGLAFIAIFFLDLPYPLIIFAAGLYGYLNTTGKDAKSASPPPQVKFAETAKTTISGLLIWFAPVIALFVFGGPPLLQEVSLFFSKLAVVTFGGAYAVLSYMAQQVVVELDWISAPQMMDALGLAETTPGPLILVTQFVGFIAGANQQGLWFGFLAALLTLWVTFAPCFLWIFAGAPYIEWISAQPRLNSALQAITAAVVGVIFNLSVWFALHVFFTQVTPQQVGPITLWQPTLASINWPAILLAVLACLLLFRFHARVFNVLALAALAGIALYLAMPQLFA